MLTARLTQFPPRFNILRFMSDLQAHIDHPDALALDRHRDAQALDDAEFAPVPLEGYTRCGVCSRTISDTARLACGSCAA